MKSLLLLRKITTITIDDNSIQLQQQQVMITFPPGKVQRSWCLTMAHLNDDGLQSSHTLLHEDSTDHLADLILLGIGQLAQRFTMVFTNL
jgi:hypothetical protein